MKKRGFGFSFVLLCILLLFPLSGGAESGSDSDVSFSLVQPLKADDTEIRIRLEQPLSRLQANAFSGEDPIAEKAEREGDRLLLTLTRTVKDGENIAVILEGEDDDGLPRSGRDRGTPAIFETQSARQKSRQNARFVENGPGVDFKERKGLPSVPLEQRALYYLG